MKPYNISLDENGGGADTELQPAFIYEPQTSFIKVPLEPIKVATIPLPEETIKYPPVKVGNEIQPIIQHDIIKQNDEPEITIFGNPNNKTQKQNEDMSKLKDLFKRKPGGTFVGNLIRSGARTATGGILGNGAMMLKPGETPQESNSRLMQGAGSAVSNFTETAFVSTPQTGTVREQLTRGAETDKKRTLAVLLGGVFGLVALVLIIKKLFKK